MSSTPIKPNGTVNMITKAGTNQLHGTLSEFNEFSAINAPNRWFVSPTVKQYASRQNQYGGTIAIRVDRHSNFRGANGVDVFLTRAEREEVNTLFSATVWNSTKKDYVVSYPYLPGVNFITGRRTFQSLLYIDNVTQSQDWQQAEIAKIQRFRPAVIVIDDWTINGTEESRFSHWAMLMTKFIESHYRLVASVNNKRVFALLTPAM